MTGAGLLAPRPDAPADGGDGLDMLAEVGAEQLLVFRVGRERFAIPVQAIEAVAEMPPVRPVPAMPAHMIGMCELRGGLVAMYSPARTLNVAPDDPQAAIVAYLGETAARPGRRIAIAISEAEGVTPFDPTAWRGVGGAVSRHGLVLGVLAHGTSVTTLVDAEAFLAACASGAAVEEA